MSELPTLAYMRSAHLPDVRTIRYARRYRSLRSSCFALCVICALCLIPQESYAHIKWFCAYDTAVPPLAFGEVFTSIFFIVAVGLRFPDVSRLCH